MMLSDLIARYKKARDAWRAQNDEDDVKANNSLEWREYMNLSWDIIYFPCGTISQVQEKATFIMNDDNLVDCLANSTEAAVKDFLKSTAGQPVDNGEK